MFFIYIKNVRSIYSHELYRMCLARNTNQRPATTHPKSLALLGTTGTVSSIWHLPRLVMWPIQLSVLLSMLSMPIWSKLELSAVWCFNEPAAKKRLTNLCPQRRLVLSWNRNIMVYFFVGTSRCYNGPSHNQAAHCIVDIAQHWWPLCPWKGWQRIQGVHYVSEPVRKWRVASPMQISFTGQKCLSDLYML